MLKKNTEPLMNSSFSKRLVPQQSPLIKQKSLARDSPKKQMNIEVKIEKVDKVLLKSSKNRSSTHFDEPGKKRGQDSRSTV
jgi:hypothetical protein